MSRPFQVHLLLEQRHLRDSLFAIGLLGLTLPVTLEIKGAAEALYVEPTLKAGKMFVRREEPIGPLQKVRMNPGTPRYDSVERDKAAPGPVPLTIELPPTFDDALALEITGIHGMLIEERVNWPEPVRQAEVRLRWLHNSGVTWRETPTGSHTATSCRCSVSAPPDLKASKNLIVRVRRDSTSVYRSARSASATPRISDRSTGSGFTWGELLP
jgi:hypothetical protein